MNRYYIELQNKLTDRIRVTIAEMNNNVFELSEENKELRRKIERAINYINIQNMDYRNDDRITFIFKKINEILGDKENE